MKRISSLVISILIVLAMVADNTKAQHKQQTGDRNQSQFEGYPIAADVLTTRQRTVVPDPPLPLETIFPYEISKYLQNGYGNWHYDKSGADSGKQIDLMAAGYSGATAIHTARLLNFFTITDIHITDEESPSQGVTVGYKGGNSSGYSPVMLYTTQVLDAAVQTINAIHKQHPFDFGISLGDTCNNTQYNELRWYIDVLDGGNINPDSGIKDDPIPGPYNDYQDEYKAAGLDKTIPWYQTLGNHDHFGMGAYSLNEELRKAYIGVEILNMGDVLHDPLGVNSRGTYMGSINGSTVYGDVIGAGLVEDFATIPTVLAADPNRRSLLRKEWISEFFKTTSNPVGHGFNQTNIDNDFASYSFEPKTDIPIKVIVLDDTQQDEDFDVRGHGYLNQERYEWLVSELDKGQADDQLMIIAAHIPINLIAFPPTTNSYISKTDLLTKLSQYPNLILWITGHRHRNVVTPRPSIDPAHSEPEYGFWEVETASLRDFPQQFRTFEILRNRDNTISILATDVDPAIKDGSMAAISRSYAVAANSLFDLEVVPSPTGAYNAELVKQLSSEMQAIIQNYGTPVQPSFVSSFNLYN